MTRLPRCFSLLQMLMLITAVSVVAANSVPASAGPLSTTGHAFFGTVNGQTGHDGGFWRGHEILNGFLGLSTDVDFAVFAPGAGFGGFLFDEYGLADPTDKTKFVYAFQAKTISNDFVLDMGTNLLNAGYDVGEDAEVVQQSSVAGTGVAPSSLQLNTSSAQYDWAGGFSAPGVSAVIFYTSPYAPQKDSLTVGSGGGDAGQSGLTSFASPSDIVPEPSTLVLLASGIAVAFVRRRRH